MIEILWRLRVCLKLYFVRFGPSDLKNLNIFSKLMVFPQSYHTGSHSEIVLRHWLVCVAPHVFLTDSLRPCTSYIAYIFLCTNTSFVVYRRITNKYYYFKNVLIKTSYPFDNVKNITKYLSIILYSSSFCLQFPDLTKRFSVIFHKVFRYVDFTKKIYNAILTHLYNTVSSERKI